MMAGAFYGLAPAYAAAKGGVLGLTREWAVDLIQFGIRSNAIIIAESYTPAYEDWIKTLEDGENVLKKINKILQQPHWCVAALGM